MITDAKIESAYGRIRSDIVRTPLEYSAPLSRLTGARVFIKWESDQTTGSFKFRGALNKLRSLSASVRLAGVLTASTGNHGLGVVRAAAMERTPVLLYLPRTAAPAKVQKLRAAGAVIEFHGSSCERAEIAARRDAAGAGKAYISPYNDPEVISGQGTIGLEILEDCPGVEAVFVPIGGGGLIAGIGAYLKGRNPAVKVIGIEPSASAFMKASFTAGRLVSIREGPTLADAVAGGIEPGSITFPLCRAYVDDIRLTGESRLREAIALIGRHHHRRVEGAGGLPLASLLKDRAAFRRRTVVLVVSGGNIDPLRWERITHLRLGD
ncbi:MAG: pyridoxal-phosphate dependent enzyme [Candidatus Aminicenantes bacterium]|nr:pyridoxal-phosphate dependent enzyme [Candidatus Aminicenantes bacterium]